MMRIVMKMMGEHEDDLNSSNDKSINKTNENDDSKTDSKNNHENYADKTDGVHSLFS